jgi:transposase
LRELSVVEQRYQAVLAVIRDGVPIVKVAHRFDVSRQAIHRWLRWYEAEGLPGLVDRSHRPPRCSHQMDPAVEVWVLEARRRNSDWGPRRLVHEASRAGLEPPPSRSGIYRALKRAGLIDPQARRHRDRKFRRWERGGPMELWQMDVVGGVLLADGKECKIRTVGKVIDAMLRNDLIVVDEVGFAPLDPMGTQLLFRFVASAYERRSRGVGSHWPFDEWGRFLPEHTTAVSMLDRLLHHAVVVVTKGSRSGCARQNTGEGVDAQEPERRGWGLLTGHQWGRFVGH